MKGYVGALIVGGFCMMTLVATSQAQTATQATVIENTVALQAAESQCGYQVDYDMLSVVFSSANLHTSDLSPGGKYWANVQQHQSRLKRLLSTSKGKASFCRNVRNDLSAMFQ